MKDEILSLDDGRFSRLEAIEWWNPDVIRNARILVIGAGALGNEIIKNLSLLGIGHIVVVDKDTVEASNLSRSVLFRDSDCGANKAVAAARAARLLYPDSKATPMAGDITCDIGLGLFRWADLVIGAVDNREARVFINSACARVGRPWIDGGIDVLNGLVRVFAPPDHACYECTMSQTDWKLLNVRRSCTLLARRIVSLRGIPTTPTSASIIGGLQVQEALKMLHGLESLSGKGFHLEGRNHSSYLTAYPISPDCPWHEPAVSIEAVPEFCSSTPFSTICQWASDRLGGIDSIQFTREIVSELKCMKCGTRHSTFRQPELLTDRELICSHCNTEFQPEFLHAIDSDSPLVERSGRSLGLPPWDIVWSRHGNLQLGIELLGDAEMLERI